MCSESHLDFELSFRAAPASKHSLLARRPSEKLADFFPVCIHRRSSMICFCETCLQKVLNDLLPRNRADFSQRNENFEEAMASSFFLKQLRSQQG